MQLHELVGLAAVLAFREAVGQKEMDPLVGETRRREDGGEWFQVFGGYAGFLGELAPGADGRWLAGVEAAGRDLPDEAVGGVTELADEEHARIGRARIIDERYDGRGARMPKHLEPAGGTVGELDGIEIESDDTRHSQALIVLGAAQYNGRPSPVLRARLDHALSLYHDGLAPWIIVTGGVGRGDTTSEALVSQRYLRARRVPDSAVVVQPQGRSTTTSMDAVADWLHARGRNRVVLVSDPFHMFRLRLEARRTALTAYTSPTESSPISNNPTLELRYLFAEGLKIPVIWFQSLTHPKP